MNRFKIIHSHTVDGDRTSQFYDNERRIVVCPEIEGDYWEIINTGTEERGHLFMHLSSKTRGRQQRNGWCPIQMTCWVSLDDLSCHVTLNHLPPA